MLISYKSTDKLYMNSGYTVQLRPIIAGHKIYILLQGQNLQKNLQRKKSRVMELYVHHVAGRVYFLTAGFNMYRQIA